MHAAPELTPGHDAATARDGTGANRRIVPVTWHPVYVAPEELSEEDVRRFAIRTAALRIAASLESRSLRTVAQDIGCSHVSLSKAVAALAERAGLRGFMRDDDNQSSRRYAGRQRRKKASE